MREWESSTNKSVLCMIILHSMLVCTPFHVGLYFIPCWFGLVQPYSNPTLFHTYRSMFVVLDSNMCFSRPVVSSTCGDVVT